MPACFLLSMPGSQNRAASSVRGRNLAFASLSATPLPSIFNGRHALASSSRRFLRVTRVSPRYSRVIFSSTASDNDSPIEPALQAAPEAHSKLLPDSLTAPKPALSLVERAPLDPRVLFGEFLATFLVIYLSVSAPAPVGALGSAAIVSAVAASFMPVSGALFNPAVTAALLVTNRIHPLRAAAFVPIQLLAAVAATALANSLGTPILFPGIPVAASSGELLRTTFAELMPMFAVVAVVFQTAVATEREGGVGNKIAPLYIGLVVLACASTFTSAFFNPCRAFGPAFVNANWVSHWVYWVGPIVGAVFAALVCTLQRFARATWELYDRFCFLTDSHFMHNSGRLQVCEHVFLAPAANRKPNSWLAAIVAKTAAMGNRVKALGVAGLIAYGIMNVVYYGSVFSFMMFRVGLSSGAGGLAQAWLVTWSLSQVTKPLRFALSIALAPFINRILVSRRAKT